MKAFMDQDFLLGDGHRAGTVSRAFRTAAIIDYHCHLDPRMVAEDYRFRSITELWLGRRPLQVACHAYQRCGRALHHGRRFGLGEV